ncbi:hypothetical protein U3516DRAFT_785542 [Neocallimastix sp. 'constans']
MYIAIHNNNTLQPRWDSRQINNDNTWFTSLVLRTLDNSWINSLLLDIYAFSEFLKFKSDETLNLLRVMNFINTCKFHYVESGHIKYDYQEESCLELKNAEYSIPLPHIHNRLRLPKAKDEKKKYTRNQDVLKVLNYVYSSDEIPCYHQCMKDIFEFAKDFSEKKKKKRLKMMFEMIHIRSKFSLCMIQWTEFRMCNDYEKPQDIYQHHNRGKVATDIFNAMKGCCKPEMLYCYLKGQLKYRLVTQIQIDISNSLNTVDIEDFGYRNQEVTADLQPCSVQDYINIASISNNSDPNED